MSKESLWINYANEKNPRIKNEIKEELIITYISLVKIISGRLYNYYGANIEYDDLVGYGILGLIDAIEKYDYTKNIKFETYASIRIRGAIIDEIRNLDWIPRSIRKKSKQLKDATTKLESEFGREPSISELAKELDKTPQEMEKLIQETNIYNVVSLEDELADNLKIQIEDKTIEINPEGSLVKKDTIEILKGCIDNLKEKEQLVINLYYYEELTYKEIGKILEISESRVSQIHSKAIEKMKKELL